MGHDRVPNPRLLSSRAGGALSDPLVVGIDARELQGHSTGTGRYLRNLLRIWTRSTPDRFALYFRGAPPPDPLLEHPRIESRSLDPRPSRGFLWQEIRLVPAARKDRLDVFFAPAYTCPLRLAVPRVTTVHDLSFFAIPHDFAPIDGIRRRLLVGASLRASAVVVAGSDFTRREILGRFPETATKLTVIPYGRDDDLPPQPNPGDARVRLGLSGPLVLTVGSIFNRRGLPVLLRAIRLLTRSRPDLTLEVVGDNRTNPLLDLRELVRGLDLERRVRLSGFVSETALADRYAAADVVVCLSDYEGFGLPALEAMARGVPVVVSNRPALSEVFGEAAVTVDPTNEIAIMGALDRVLGDRTIRADLRERGKVLASRYSWARTARLTREALCRAAGQR